MILKLMTNGFENYLSYSYENYTRQLSFNSTVCFLLFLINFISDVSFTVLVIYFLSTSTVQEPAP